MDTRQRAFARLQQLFDEAMELPAAQREAFVATACADDPATAASLRELLRQEQRLAVSDTAAQFGGLPSLAAEALPGLLGEGARIGPYTLLAQVGVGGMGRVFRAERVTEDFRQSVAIKLLRQELVEPSLLRRFSAERQLLAALDHPGICRLIDAGALADGTPYAVMEFVDGEDLLSFADRRRLRLDERLRLFRQVLAAVAYAHRHLVVHRDIKAGNVLVDGEGRIRLLDFGIAKALDGSAEATATRERYLSFSNAAPEQLRGDAISVACDVYALGGVLYELLCGLPPFALEGVNAAALETQILHVPPPPMARRGADAAAAAARGFGDVAALQRGLGGDLERIVQTCLRKEPAARYATVEQLDDDVASFLARRPIRAADGQRFYRLRKFIARHRVSCTLAALLALALGGVLAAVFARNVAAARERDRAQQALALLREAFLAADPARVAGEAVTVRAVLDAARPALEQRFEAQPELYASLAGSLAEVQLSLGLSTEAAALFDRAANAAQRGDLTARERHDLHVLRARALFAAGEFGRADEALQAASALGVPTTPEWRVVQSSVLAHAGNVDAAEQSLRAAIVAMDARGAEDEWANLARLRLAELLGQNRKAEDGLAVLDATLAWQRGRIGADHPRVTLARLQRVIALRQLGRHEEALRDAATVHTDAVAAYGAQSPFAARAAMVLGNVQAGLSRRDEAIASYRDAVAIFRATIGATHPNSLRASYNLAEMLAPDATRRAEALQLYRDTLAAAEQRFGAQSNAVVLFRLGHARLLLADGQARAALALLTTPAAASGFAIARPDNRRDFAELLRRSHAEAGCAANPAHADCARAAELAATP